jgi:hypothetical protein
MVDSFQPGISSYTGSTSANASANNGGSAETVSLPAVVDVPFSVHRYPTQMRSVSRPSSTSSLVRHSPDTLELMMERRSDTASNQPQRRLRPVTAPNSWPTRERCSPYSSNSSVGNGPAPTRVVYAFTIPST